MVSELHLELCWFPIKMSDVSDDATPTWFDPCLDPSSPYHIHPSENPSSVSIYPTLDGNNYHSWSRSIRMALISKNKIGFLAGTIPAPDVHSPSYPSWERCNTLVMSWLLNSLSPPIAQSVIFLNRVVDIWTDLRKCFLKVIYFASQSSKRKYMVSGKSFCYGLFYSTQIYVGAAW